MGIKAARADNPSRTNLAVAKDYGKLDWDDERPQQRAFELMRAVSKQQVIFGGNYFADILPPSPAWIVWDKDNGENDFADAELAWTSHKRAVRKVRWRWNGMLQEPGVPKEERVHPTQKPTGVMEWVLNEYTEPGEIVLDPFMGSGTTGVACLRTGRTFIGIEREPKYFDLAVRRIEAELARHPLFD